jgi:hypothetical protein
LRGNRPIQGFSERRLIRLLALLLFFSFLLLLPGDWSRAESGEWEGFNGPVGISELVEHMGHYDGKTVTVEGEVVGDVMNRDGGAWLTVNDDPYALRSLEEGGDFAGVSNSGIGVWVAADMTREIQHTGDYQEKGDRVRISGVFHRACGEHGGDADIHAQSLEVLVRGYRFEHPFQWKKLAVVLLLLFPAVFLWTVRERTRRKRKRRATK